MKKTIAIVGISVLLLASLVVGSVLMSNEGSIVFTAHEKPLEAQTYIYVEDVDVDCSEYTSNSGSRSQFPKTLT